MTERRPPTDSRAIAATALGQVLRRQSSLDRALDQASAGLPPRERAFVAELCFGTARHYPRLDGILAQLLDKPLRARDSDIQALLLLGCYQLSYLRVPDHAAISATVDAARTLDKAWARGLINGVLRQYQRGGETLVAGLDEAAAASHPRWLWERLGTQWPGERAEILRANNSAPPMTLRVNARHTSPRAYLERLAEAGIQARQGLAGPSAIQLDAPCNVAELPGFASGDCSVQDESSQLVAPLLQPASRRRILDCCSAPGGKTGHILELGQSDLQLHALDIDVSRLARVEENLERLGLHATLLQADAADTAGWWDGQPYDAILLDAPCSATGVIRRHPDIKLLRQASDAPRLAAQQTRLLESVWPCLGAGGVLVYTTCSILNEENDAIIDDFLSRTADAEPLAIDAGWGLATTWGRQILPQVGGPDGFYYARLRKVADHHAA